MPLGGAELLILLAILLLFFGAKRIPQLARSLGTGARELKKAASEEDDENQTKEPNKVEAHERGEETKPIPEEDARLEEQNSRIEPNSKA